jgi:hypothetical protein
MDKVRKIIRETLEEMAREQRYVAEIDFFIWADNDEDAQAQAQSIAAELDAKYDNRASVKTLGTKPSGIGNFSSIDISQG